MIATNTEPHTEARPKPPPGPAGKNPKGNNEPAPDNGPVPAWDEMVRRGTVLRLMEHLNVGVQQAADLGKDPAFSADDRLQAVLVMSRMINANARLGKAIGYLAQVEQRRRTVIQHLAPPKAWNDSNSIPEVLLERDLVRKMLRYMKVIADERFDPAITQAEAAEKARKEKAAPANPAEAKSALAGTARMDGASPSA